MDITKYTYSTCWDEKDKVFIGKVAEFKSLSAHGNSQKKSFEEIKKVVSSVVEDLKKNNEEIPLPFNMREFSGKICIRIPKILHRTLSKTAMEKGISLNKLIVSKLVKE